MRSRKKEAQSSLYPQMSRQSLFFFSIVIFIGIVFCAEIALFRYVNIDNKPKHEWKEVSGSVGSKSDNVDRHISLPDHLIPHIPIVPIFNSISNAEDRIADLMDGRPSMAGVVALLQKFVLELHKKNQEVIRAGADGHVVIKNFFYLTEKYLKPFDNLYQGRNIFPVRSDDSIYISIAAFREFYLTETLVSAFKHAKNPEKLFIGAVVQNCFGKTLEDGTLETSGTPCFSGGKIVDVKANGQKVKKVFNVSIDKNGVEEFCKMPDYEIYCKNGQFRVLYVHDIDSQGPSMARYYASKLWGGENYYMQIDSHLRFAHHWDAKYIAEMKLTSSFPKSLMSAYPPGFEQVRFIPKSMGIDKSKVNNETVIESPGCRLCHCGSPENHPNPIIIIKQSKSYRGNETRPSQTPFLGAGMIFTHGSFLGEVPYDPYLPWTFMGEEILLSMRAWTHGFNIYAPRKNLIIHQYRPAKLGLPKYHTTVQRTFKQGFGNNWLQHFFMARLKHLCGYPSHTVEKIEAQNLTYVLVDRENYGIGSARSWEDYLKHAGITANFTSGKILCPKRLPWCLDGTKY